MASPFTVFDLLAAVAPEPVSLHLKCIGGRKGLGSLIAEPELNRPGLALCGFYENFGDNRIQIFGRGESSYLMRLQEKKDEKALQAFFARPMACCIFTHSLRPTQAFLQCAEAAQIPILQTPLPSNEFQNRLLQTLSGAFALKESIHGVFVEVYGLGLLIKGESGVGKSETALELIERGHRLVADDLVEASRIGDALLGAPVVGPNRHSLEIRGLGIVDIAKLFGIRAVRDNKRIDLVVQLESWQEGKRYDRIGKDNMLCTILGVQLPLIEVPIKPGRNIPVIMEAAVLKERLKKGLFAEDERRGYCVDLL